MLFESTSPPQQEFGAWAWIGEHIGNALVVEVATQSADIIGRGPLLPLGQLPALLDLTSERCIIKCYILEAGDQLVLCAVQK